MNHEGSALVLTGHASMRIAQRHLSGDDVAYVLANGTRVRRTGVTFVFLRARDIPSTHQRTRSAKLEGTVVMLARDGDIMTVYRSSDKRRGLRAIQKKTKYRRPSQPGQREVTFGNHLAA